MPFLKAFAGLDRSTRDNLADIRSPMQLAFAALLIAREQCSVAGMTAEHIVAALEAAGVSVSRSSVQKALGRAGSRVARQVSQDGETIFRLMLRGEREVAHLLDQGSLQVFRFDGTAPRSAKSKVGVLLSTVSGLVRVCDPYYGLRTLDTLEQFPKTTAVRFLTAKTSEAGPKLTAALRDFKKERPAVEFRLVSAAAGLHDRFILTTTSLMLVGHGLKDIGAKESFLVILDTALAPDLVGETAKAFDARWAAAGPI